MDTMKHLGKKRMSDATKVTIARWWFVGAVYFFVAFGTNLGNMISAIDLIFFLGVGIGVANIFVLHPVVYNMFSWERRGESANKAYLNRTIKQNVCHSLVEIFRCLGTVLLVYMVYQGINTALVALLDYPVGTVILPGEPILFAIFFVCIYNGTDTLVDFIIMKRKKANEAKQEK